MRRWWSDFLHGNGPVGRCVPTGIAGRRRPGRGKGIAITIACAVVIGAASWVHLDSNGHLDNTTAFVKAPAQDALSVSFVFCALSYELRRQWRHLLVLDEKIRMADIDTPELSPPRCEAERIKGEAAKSRLLKLLNAPDNRIPRRR
ncbi:hypothetical protein GGQ65_006187 [Rhizobium fabae]|uniref:Uncharacterized protein n=1 Tax=Rhizobium fabae TaxID=573179 RepID=A0A7W6FM57_9HYPH|nr:hypothetical protein [Rhizobium fabae]